MIPLKVREILRTLLTRSEVGAVKWVDSRTVGMTTAVEDDYIVALPDSSINVFRTAEGEIRVNILNSEGDVVVSISSDYYPEDKALLSSLIESARNSVLNIEGTLASIERALKSNDVVGGSTPRLKGGDVAPF